MSCDACSFPYSLCQCPATITVGELARIKLERDTLRAAVAAPPTPRREDMDPNANLAEQRRIIARIHNAQAKPGDAARLADLAEALDQWIAGGGFLPDSWAGSCADHDRFPEAGA